MMRVTRYLVDRHYAHYVTQVSEETEVIFRPLRIAVSVTITNHRDTPLMVTNVNLGAVLRRGLDGRLDPIPFECIQLNGDLSPSSELYIEPYGKITGFVHFSKRVFFEVDALRFFRFKVEFADKKTELFRFRVKDTYSGHIGQSNVEILTPPHDITAHR